MPKPILVTSATGKQGRAIVNALLAAPDAAEYTILAVTRHPTSPAAQRLAGLSQSITLVKGDMNDVPALFAEAAAATPDGIWGVVCNPAVKMGEGTGALQDTQEVKQAAAMLEEARTRKVAHFVYQSVDRGGEEHSWTNPTDVPHFKTKHFIEHYIRDNAEGMNWTILRPVIFMDNLEPGMMGKVLLTYIREWMGPSQKMYWVATADIGYFAALAFRSTELNHRALTVASDYLSFDDINAAFEKVTGSPAPTTYAFLTWPMRFVNEMRTMVRWFHQEGYVADLPELRKLDPQLTSFEEWLKRDSKFVNE